MNTQQTLAEAASRLTVQDYEYLRTTGVLEEAGSQEASSQETASQEASSQSKKKRRRRVSHPWPEVNTILQADYAGVHYEAQVIEAPGYKSGKALKILTGPASGKVCHSPSGAMLLATEKQRQEQGLGRKGVTNGWGFWKVQQGGGEA